MDGGRASRVRPRSNSMDAEGPPHQRLRSEADTSGTTASTSTADRPQKDQRYYRADGDCTVRVEDTLFKIHRYHLSEESSVFRSMFSLPSGLLTSQGQDDDNPIVLSGDTPAQFRAFLSFAYSNPSQLQINRMSVDDLEKLANMTSFAHKYVLQDCLLWALESMEHILIYSAAMVPANQYPKILEVTALCIPLHAPICDRICGLLKRQWIVHIVANGLPIGPALDIAERFNLRSFLVELYSIVLDRLANSPESQCAAADGPLSSISPTHLLRIFSGDWFLSRRRSYFINHPPMISHRPACSSSSLCGRHWAIMWTDISKQFLSSRNRKIQGIFRKLDDFKDNMTRG
ncbi:hypothetical protein B0H11DRAFT_211164, partial [Mycena galericulata]